MRTIERSEVSHTPVPSVSLTHSLSVYNVIVTMLILRWLHSRRSYLYEHKKAIGEELRYADRLAWRLVTGHRPVLLLFDQEHSYQEERSQHEKQASNSARRPLPEQRLGKVSCPACKQVGLRGRP